MAMPLDLAVTQFRPVKADPAASLESIARTLRRAKEATPRPHLVLLPEASLTGYDLEGGVEELAWTAGKLFRALRRIHAETWGPDEPLDVALGFYERRAHRAWNSAMYAQLGGSEPGIRHVHRKVFLPTYGLFQEARFLEAGREIRAFDTRWGRAAMLVCEDLFHGLSTAMAALDGAEVLLVPSAAPARGPAGTGEGEPASVGKWRRVARAAAEEHGVYVAVSQMVGFEGGKAFAGGAGVTGPDGTELARSPLWQEDLRSVRLDLEALDRARARSPLLEDLRRSLPRIRGAPLPAEGTDGTEDEGDAAADAAGEAGADGPDPAAAPDPDDRSPLAIDADLLERWLVEFLRQEAMEGRGFERAVVGLSGGVDSAVTAYLAARAFGPEEVTALLMPAGASTGASGRLARQVIEELGIGSATVELEEPVEALVRSIGGEMSPLRRGNLTARLRMAALFDRSKALEAIPLGTGNKSERLLGYFTWHADDAPPINPLGDLYKSQVWTLARHLGVPEEIVERPPSAELVPDQTDEEELGVSYREADLILHHLLSGHGPEALTEAGFDARAVEIVHGRLESTHWKRHLPTSAVLTDAAIGVSYLRPVDF
jgi:NAD+ synthetase